MGTELRVPRGLKGVVVTDTELSDVRELSQASAAQIRSLRKPLAG